MNIGQKIHSFLQIGAILLHFKILENVYPERKPTRYWLKLYCAFLFQSTWDAKIMVTLWLQLSDKVMFEDDYTAKFFFRTLHVNIFFILRTKRTTCKKISLWYLMPFCGKKCWILARKSSHNSLNLNQSKFHWLNQWFVFSLICQWKNISRCQISQFSLK